MVRYKQECIAVLEASPDVVLSLSLSPDGTTLISDQEEMNFRLAEYLYNGINKRHSNLKELFMVFPQCPPRHRLLY